MVGDSFTGAGKRPSRDHAHKVLLPNGKKGRSWLARLIPWGGQVLDGSSLLGSFGAVISNSYNRIVFIRLVCHVNDLVIMPLHYVMACLVRIILWNRLI